MNSTLQLKTLLADPGRSRTDQLVLFALVSLGVIEALANGLMSATEGVRTFFHAENCLFVRRQLREKAADKLMSHGVQLPDLFDLLPAEEAQRQFQHELGAMRLLCLKLLERNQPLTPREVAQTTRPG